MQAASEFKYKTTGINQMWQTDFTYLKIIGWGWMYLSTILDDFSRYVVAWKLCTGMTSRDVTETLDLLCRPQVAARLMSFRNRDCCPTMDRVTSRATSPTGSATTG